MSEQAIKEEGEALGLDSAFIQSSLSEAEAQVIEIDEGHLLAYQLASQLLTQINKTAHFSGVYYDGFNYQAVESVFRLNRIPEDEYPDLFEQIRLIERGVIEVLNGQVL